MDKSAAVRIAGSFARAIEARGITLHKLVLYGSCANSTCHEGSDIDLVVISKDFDGKSYWERINVLSDAIYEVFAPIEAVAMTPDEWERGDSDISRYAMHGDVVYSA